MQEEIITDEESSFNQTLVKGIERFKKAAAEVKDVVLGAQMCMQCISTTITKHTSYGSRGNCRVAQAQDPTNRGQGQICMASGKPIDANDLGRIEAIVWQQIYDELPVYANEAGLGEA
jgi:alanyl-tRNA synthetase